MRYELIDETQLYTKCTHRREKYREGTRKKKIPILKKIVRNKPTSNNDHFQYAWRRLNDHISP